MVQLMGTMTIKGMACQACQHTPLPTGTSSQHAVCPQVQVTTEATALLAFLHIAIHGSTVTASAPATSRLCGVQSHLVSGHVAWPLIHATGRPHSPTRTVSRTAVWVPRSSRRGQLEPKASCSSAQRTGWQKLFFH